MISKTGDVFFSNNKTQEEKDNKLIGRKTKRDDKNVNKIVIDIDSKNILGLGEDLFNFNSIEESYKASRNKDRSAFFYTIDQDEENKEVTEEESS